jgi:hypothetical protein
MKLELRGPPSGKSKNKFERSATQTSKIQFIEFMHAEKNIYIFLALWSLGDLQGPQATRKKRAGSAILRKPPKDRGEELLNKISPARSLATLPTGVCEG